MFITLNHIGDHEEPLDYDNDHRPLENNKSSLLNTSNHLIDQSSDGILGDV